MYNQFTDVEFGSSCDATQSNPTLRRLDIRASLYNVQDQKQQASSESIVCIDEASSGSCEVEQESPFDAANTAAFDKS